MFCRVSTLKIKKNDTVSDMMWREKNNKKRQ